MTLILSAGDVGYIYANTCGHGFPLGTIVRIAQITGFMQKNSCYRMEADGDFWFGDDEDVVGINGEYEGDMYVEGKKQ